MSTLSEFIRAESVDAREEPEGVSADAPENDRPITIRLVKSKYPEDFDTTGECPICHRRFGVDRIVWPTVPTSDRGGDDAFAGYICRACISAGPEGMKEPARIALQEEQYIADVLHARGIIAPDLDDWMAVLKIAAKGVPIG